MVKMISSFLYYHNKQMSKNQESLTNFHKILLTYTNFRVYYSQMNENSEIEEW